MQIATEADPRVTPHEPQAERGLVGACLLGKLDDVAQVVQPDDLFSPAHRTLYRRILEMHRREMPIDELSVISELRRFEELEEVGGPANVTLMTEGVPRNCDVRVLAEPVVATARARHMLARLKIATDLAYDSRIIDATAVVSDLAASDQAPKSPAALDDVAILDLPEPGFLIDKLFPLTALTLIVGAPEVGKTFLAIRLGLSGCTGRPFFGHRVPEAAVGPWIHISAEGLYGMGRRLAAAKIGLGIPVDDVVGFYTWPDSIDLLSAVSVDRFITAVRRLKPRGVTIDTYARNFTGEENNTRDTGLAVLSLERIKRSLNCAVIVLHHPNAEGTKERGNTALRGAMDAVYELAGIDERLVLSCSKMKDAAKPPPINLRLVPPAPGLPSCTIELADGLASTDELSPQQIKALDCLRGTFPTGATHAEWRAASGIPERTLYEVRTQLERKHRVMRVKGNRFAAVESWGQ